VLPQASVPATIFTKSQPLRTAKGTASPEFYYQTTLDALQNDGDILTVLDVLARQVGILGIFSDWAGTVTYYASCMGLS
jgi:glycerophosphoryl diester phosphodiesterase